MPQICTPAGADVTGHHVWVAADQAAASAQGLEPRRQRLLRAVGPALGPAQFQHTTGHCEHVARTSAGLARLMRLDEAGIELVRLAGLLHDIGKMLVPDAILAKPGPLTPEEREVMRAHIEHSAALSEHLGADAATVEAVRHHHTRFDVGAAPKAAHIVAVADALVTMTSDRPYSSARSFSDALAELRLGRGTVFCPDAVVAAHILGATVMSHAA